MKKIISLVLSFTLIFGSVAPSYAQGKGRLVKQASQALTQEGLAKNLTRVNGLSTVLREATVGAASQIHLRVSQLYNSQLALRTVSRSYADISALMKLSTFTDANGLEVARQIFMVEHAALDKELLLLNTLPELLITKGFPIIESRINEALEFYRRSLLETNSKVSTLSVAELGESFGKSMSAVSTLGFYGTSADAKLLLQTYEAFVPYVNDAALQLAVGRSLLAMGAYGEFESFVALVKKPSKEVWEGFKTASESIGAEISLPQTFGEGSYVLSDAERAFLTKYNSLNVALADPSAQATLDWLALSQKKGMVVKTPAEVSAAVPDLKLNLSVSTGENLAVGASPVPQSEISVETAQADLATQSVTAGEVGAGYSPAAPRVFSGPFSNLTTRVKRFFGKSSDTQIADEEAKLILANISPLRSQLRRVLESPCSASYKQQALLNLYYRGVFNNTLSTLPEETNALIKKYRKDKKDAELSKLLFNLYETGVLTKDISALVDNREQALFSDLERITQSPDWEAKAKAAYERAETLPLEGENFGGVVPSVPEANQQSIMSTFRMEPNFAVDHMSLGIEKGDYMYYENQIPFYYRDAKGKLSSKPVGILSQEPAGPYGRILSAIGLANKPGFRVPKGFVLTLDESGQWKWFMPKGSLAIVEGNPTSKKLMEEIRTKGSVRVPVDTPYSTTDLLAMANMLEANKGSLNLELTLNTPHSLKQYLTVHGYFVGNDAGASLAGPFKQSLKSIEGLSGFLGNMVSGIGYLTPWVGGALMKKMTKWGNVKTTQAIYGLAGAGLGYSLLKLKMFGTVDPATISLAELAIPTVALVLGASLANTFIQTFLNFYKDPTARTAAHLAFSENKQWSRLALTVGSAVAAAAFGLNWTVVVPVGLLLVGLSEMLFLNTPIYMDAQRLARAKKLDAQGLLPESEKAFLESAMQATQPKISAADEARYRKSFQEMIATLPEVKDIKTRVKMVYASYAASLLVLNQATSAVLGSTAGQVLVGTFMLATALTRKFASKMVSQNKMTDDQLTGASLPLLAASGAGLALMPYSGIAGIAAIGLGILHYMATAVPGQLDAARWQNIVSAQSQKLKAEVQQQKAAIEVDASISAAEKEAQLLELDKQLKDLDMQEKIWSSEAAKGYSYANGHGLIGITVAGLGALLFSDLAPTWAQDFLGVISNFFGEEASLSLGRLIFGYAAGTSTVLAMKNWRLTQDFMQVFKKKAVTAEALAEGKVSAETFSMSAKNAERRLAELNGGLKKLDTKMVEYGISSEQKMTDILKVLINTHNRFVAAREVLGETNPTVVVAFQNLQKRVATYKVLLQNNSKHLSTQLAREYAKLEGALFEGGDPTKLAATPTYIEEGSYGLPQGYAKFTEARALLSEIDNQAAAIIRGEVGAETYKKIVSYQKRFKTLVTEYAAQNVGESSKVAELNNKLTAIMSRLKLADAETNILEAKAGPTSAKDIQDLRDVLGGYKIN